MNNKLLLIPLVSLSAIVQLPQTASAEAFSADVARNSDRSLEVSEVANLSNQDSSVAVRSIATPEVTNDVTTTLQAEVPQAPDQLSAQTNDPTIALTAAPTIVSQSVAAQTVAQTVAQASVPSGITTTTPVKIEVGSRGIPPITDLPARIALPDRKSVV